MNQCSNRQLVPIRDAESTAKRTSMNITDHTIFESLKKCHRAQYTMGRLMSPEEVEEATEGYDPQVQSRIRGHWFLCGDCSQEMFDDIVEQGDVALRHSLGVFQRGDGSKFLVVTHQLGNAQHRFLVPMWDPRVPDLLDAVSLGRYSISLARKGDTHALVLSADANAPLAAGLRKHLDMPMPDPQQLQRLLQALPKLMETAAEPENFPELIEGVAVTDVSLSVVFDTMVPSLGKLLATKVGANGATVH
jgi:hypothetical protein